MLCQVQFIRVSLAPTSAWHTEPNWHSMHLGNRNPCHAERLMQRNPPDSIFLSTSGEAQKAEHQSESQNLPGALPFAPGREQAVGVYHLLLQPASFPSSCLLFTCHRAYYSFAILGDHFALSYETNPCVFQKKQKLSCFTGVCGYCGAASMSAFQALQSVCVCREITTWLKTQQGTREAE